MPSAWVIGSVVIKSSFVVLVISILVSMLLFRFLHPFNERKGKQYVDEIGTIFIGIAVSIIIGKILLNVSEFITDPIAILAYPSDSKAFYIGLLFVVVYVKWRVIRSYDHFEELFFSWMFVFFAASFLYEFVISVFGNGTGNGISMVIPFVLLIGFLLLYEKVAIGLLAILGMVLWSLGQLLFRIFDQTSIFQFYVSPIFYGLNLLIGIMLLLYRRKVLV